MNTAVQPAPGVTQRVAEYVASASIARLPPKTVESAKKLLLDGIGCLIAGTAGTEGAIAAAASAELATTSEASSVFINRTRASARDAAFVNGITLYSVGVNDIHKPSGSHPGGCIIPVLLAVGEWKNSSGEELIAAMAAGYDLMGKLGRALIPSHRDRGFHPTGTFGAFGATAAGARLLKLDAKRTACALGIAGSQAAGLKAFQTDGSSTMIFHAGRAAQNGVEAAVLAQHGFTGPRTVLEDRQGFAAATADEYRIEAITAGLGSEFEVDATTFRPFYGCTLTICASAATAEVIKRHPGKKAADVAAIKVRCHPVVIEEVGNANPETLLAARLSLPYNVALVIARGDVVVADLGEVDLWDEGIRRLLPRVTFESDASMPRYGSAVTIRFARGGEDEAENLSPKGDPENPMTWEDIVQKFLRLVAPVAVNDKATAVASLVRNLEKTNGRALAAAIRAACGGA